MRKISFSRSCFWPFSLYRSTKIKKTEIFGMYNVKYFVSFYEEGKFLNKLEV